MKLTFDHIRQAYVTEFGEVVYTAQEIEEMKADPNKMFLRHITKRCEDGRIRQVAVPLPFEVLPFGAAVPEKKLNKLLLLT